MLTTKTILKTALLVGTLDITAAFIQVYLQTDKSPFKPILIYIAGGLFGKNSGLSETAMIVVGLLLHYVIAASFTVFFFLTMAKLQATIRYPLLIGILYGLFIWAVMNIFILPISNTRPFVFNAWKNALAASILIVCIGIPLAFIAAKTAKPKPFANYRIE